MGSSYPVQASVARDWAADLWALSGDERASPMQTEMIHKSEHLKSIDYHPAERSGKRVRDSLAHARSFVMGRRSRSRCTGPPL